MPCQNGGGMWEGGGRGLVVALEQTHRVALRH